MTQLLCATANQTRGSGGKITIFLMGHMTKVSTQIHSSIPQYDVYKVLLKNFEWKVHFGGVKVDIFAPRAQQVGLVLRFWWILMLRSF